MARCRRRDEEDEECSEEERGSSKKLQRSRFIEYAAEEASEDESDEDSGGSRRRRRGGGNAMRFIDYEAEVDSDEDEEEDEDDAEDGFIIDSGDDLPAEEQGTDRRRPFQEHEEEEEEDIEEIEKRIRERYRSTESEYQEEETLTAVEQRALLPSVLDPKLWLVKCAIGREKEAVVWLIRKLINKGPKILKIRSAISPDYLKGYIYIEAEKEAHVKEACEGLRFIFLHQKIVFVPVKEMASALDLYLNRDIGAVGRDTWVRIKIGQFKGQLGKVVDVNNVKNKVTVKLVVPKKTQFLEHGFVYKTMSMRSIIAHDIKRPTIDELEKFHEPGQGLAAGGNLSTVCRKRKTGRFVKGDRVVVAKGDLKNLKGIVEIVEDKSVHVRPEMKGLPSTVVVSESELCKYFELGNHVKVVNGVQEGATGMIIKVDSNVVTVLYDATREHFRVFADDVVESSKMVTSADPDSTVVPIHRVGEYRRTNYGNAMTVRGIDSSRGGRGQQGGSSALGEGSRVKIFKGVFKGCRGRVKEVKGQSIRIELESQMKVVSVDRSCVCDDVAVAAPSTPFRDCRTPMRGCETPMRMRTPRRGSETPMGMRTPIHSHAWHI